MANEFKIKKGLIVTGASGGTVVDIQGSQGQLFSVTDDLSGSIFAVADISGVPILDVNSSGLSTFSDNVVIGSVDSVVTGLNIGEASPTIQLFDTTNDGKLLMYMQDSSAVIGTYSNHSLNLFTNSTLALGFDASQNATFAGTTTLEGDLYLTANTDILKAGTNPFRLFTNGTLALSVSASQNATFAAQAFSTATSSGDGSSTLTTKGYVDSLITGATIYRGAWDPSGGGYGSPDLSGVTQTSGYYYICSAAGTAEPNGTGCEPDSWETGDWVIWNDDIVDCAGTGTGGWQKIDNSSVLSGVGTGQTVALWEGAGSVTDSETLGNAPITVSGNDTTFAGNITALTGAGSGNITVGRNANEKTIIDVGDQVNSITAYQDSDGDATHNFTLNRVFGGTGDNDFIIQKDGTAQLTLDTSANATFAGNVTFGDSHFIGDDANDNLLIQSSANENIIIDSLDELLFRNSGTTNLTIDSSGNATFAGDVTATTFLGNSTTQTAGNNSTLIATTAYADAAAGAVPIGNYLPLAGGTLTGGLIGTSANFADGVKSSDGFFNNIEGIRLSYPNGGSNNALGNSGTTGALKIALPQSWTSTMMRMTIKVYEYTTNESFTLHCGGYNYSSGGGSWLAEFAYIESQANSDRNFTIRFGHDGSKCCIYIGELASVWQYPKVFVTDFEAGFNNTIASNWQDGWVISMETTAFGSVTGSFTNTQVNNWQRNGQDLYYGSGTGNVGIGTTSPSKKLEVNGSFKLGTNAYIEYGGVYPYTITTANTAAVGNLVFSAGLGSAAYESKIDLQGTNTAGVAGITLSTASTARMVVTADGDVGIGTTTPLAKLDIQGTQGQLFSVTDDLSGSIFAVSDISGVPIFDVNSSGISYFDGNVGIGTTSPAAPLDVNGVTVVRGGSFSTPNDARTDVGLVIAEEDFIYTLDGSSDYLRRLIGKASDVIQIGEPGTSLIDGINLKPGTTGGYVQIFNNASVAAKFVNENLSLGMTDPQQKLHIVDTDGANIILNSNTGAENNGIWMTEGGIATPYANGVYVHYDSTNNAFKINTGTTSLTTKLAILRDSGNVGIGTTTPDKKLEVSAATDTTISIASSDTSINVGQNIGILEFASNNETSLSQAYTPFSKIKGISETAVTGTGSVNGAITFETASANVFGEKMRITSGGNVGIGTDNPGSKLTVATSMLSGGTDFDFLQLAFDGGWSGNVGGLAAINFTDSITSTNTVGRIGVTYTGSQGKFVVTDLYSGGYAASGDVFTIQADGQTYIKSNVGIGTTSPGTNKLRIIGNTAKLEGSGSGYTAWFITNSGTGNAGNYYDAINGDTAGGDYGFVGQNNSGYMSYDIGTQSPMPYHVFTGGNVGIGTTSPSAKLHVHTDDDNAYAVRIEGSTNNVAGVWTGLGIGGEANNTKSAILFEDVGLSYSRGKLHLCVNNEANQNSATTADAKLTVSNDGNVGINTTTPAYLLDVRDGTSSGAIARFTAINAHVIIESSTAGPAVLHLKPNTTGNKSGQFKVTTGEGYNFRWSNDAAGTAEVTYMTLDTSTTGGGDLTVKGDIIAYGAPSDERYKENIKPIESALDKVEKLQGVTFDWKESDSILDIKEDIGFIAQDVQKVVPELVRENEDGKLSLRYQGITPILLEAIKELKAEIEELKKQIK